MPVRLGHSIVKNSLGAVGRPKQALAFAKSWVRYPLEHAASRAINATPAVGFADLFPDFVAPAQLPMIANLERHDWNVRLDEKIYLGLFVQALNAQRILEIGTFDGGTTLALAQSAGAEARIWTLDLPPQEFDATQSPKDFSGAQVGAKFQNTPCAAKITQLLGDSTKFDFKPYAKSMDLVFVDAAHDYIHGLPDSINALRSARPGGLVVWHDYGPYWHGLVHAINQAARPYKLMRLAGTTLALIKLPAA